MRKVLLHPAHCRRFHAAVDRVVLGIRDANLEAPLAELGEDQWKDAIVEAVVTELQAQSTGLRAVVNRLRR